VLATKDRSLAERERGDDGDSESGVCAGSTEKSLDFERFDLARIPVRTDNDTGRHLI
jgi:hypothetical protein